MKIQVFFETNKLFDNRKKNLKNKFSFSDFIHEFDNKKSTNMVHKEIDYRDSTCVITPYDLSATTNWGIEQFDLFAEWLCDSGTENILINNPSKMLTNILENRNDVIFNNKPTFNKIKIDKIKKLNKELNKNIIGQKKAVNIIIRKLFIQKMRSSTKPLVLMFYGNPGIGKTEAAKQISKSLYGSNKLIREQMSMSEGVTSIEYFKSTNHEKDSFSKKLLSRESNIILLDEFALSPSYIQTAFFQVFDEGKFVDQNYSVDMRNSIIICTSNYTSTHEMYNNISPALLSRFDALVPFEDFSNEEKIEISQKILNDYIDSKNMNKKYIEELNLNKVKEEVLENANKGNNFRQIRSYVEDIIANSLIKNGILKD